jgi:hypothetical protein
MAKKRNYGSEYKNYQGKPDQIANRSKRNAARSKLEKEGRVHKGDGKDVDHKQGVAAGNGAGNLRVQSKSSNRSYARDSKGGDTEITGTKPANKRKK